MTVLKWRFLIVSSLGREGKSLRRSFYAPLIIHTSWRKWSRTYRYKNCRATCGKSIADRWPIVQLWSYLTSLKILVETHFCIPFRFPHFPSYWEIWTNSLIQRQAKRPFHLDRQLNQRNYMFLIADNAAIYWPSTCSERWLAFHR